MNSTHIHLLLNHFPVIGTLIGSGLLLWGIVKKQDQVKTIAAAILVLMALLAIPVYLTGEPAEESVEKLPGVMESMIEMHEDAATIAIWLMGLAGLAALLSLFLHWQKKSFSKTAFSITFVLALICFAAMARTGYYGGQIRHTEIRTGAEAALQNSNEGGNGEKGKDKDDD